MENLYYDVNANILAHMMECDIVRYEDREEHPEAIEYFVLFCDLMDNRMHIQEVSEFEENFIPIGLDEVDKVQDWYGFDDIQFAKFKKILVEIINYEE